MRTSPRTVLSALAVVALLSGAVACASTTPSKSKAKKNGAERSDNLIDDLLANKEIKDTPFCKALEDLGDIINDESGRDFDAIKPAAEKNIKVLRDNSPESVAEAVATATDFLAAQLDAGESPSLDQAPTEVDAAAGELLSYLLSDC